MKITTAWAASEVDGEMPWLVAAYDEFTEDAWGETPDWFTEASEKYGPVRILHIEIPESAVTDRFTTPTIPATRTKDTDGA